MCFSLYSGEAVCFPFFMPKIGFGVTLGVTFGVTKTTLQKRNVLRGVTFGVTLLTLLEYDSVGSMVV